MANESISHAYIIKPQTHKMTGFGELPGSPTGEGGGGGVSSKPISMCILLHLYPFNILYTYTIKCALVNQSPIGNHQNPNLQSVSEKHRLTSLAFVTGNEVVSVCEISHYLQIVLELNQITGYCSLQAARLLAWCMKKPTYGYLVADMVCDC